MSRETYHSLREIREDIIEDIAWVDDLVGKHLTHLKDDEADNRHHSGSFC